MKTKQQLSQKDNGLKRRDFMRVSTAAGISAFFSDQSSVKATAASDRRRRIAIVGVGSRYRMYLDSIQRDYSDICKVVGLCDVNLGRLKYAQQRSQEATGEKPPIFESNDFDKMVSETTPDTVIVTTVDGFHHKYIVRAMELGCDVITEKPLTVDETKCQKIIDTQRRTGRKCTVTFNYRYSPPRTQIKELLMSGEIGDILSVDFHWMLNTHHGADYFRRWHSQKKFSGGLMVHKATHHFDLVNWWLSAIPVSVFATGKREFYTPLTAKRLGLTGHHQRCHTCPEKDKCAFELSLAKNPGLKAIYLDNEKYDGYYRDRCVFRPGIDIEDTMNVLVSYDSNVTLCYSLNAFNAWEGYNIAFNGSKGRLEHKTVEKIYVSGTDTVQGGIEEGGVSTRILPLRGSAYDVDVWTGEGGHGGGDRVLLADLFAPEKKKDKYLRAADQRSGAYSILTGVAANHSLSSGKPTRIADLVQNIDYPDYPLMPTHFDPIPMPRKFK